MTQTSINLHGSSEVLELVHSDICGPMSVESVGGNLYYLLFIDDKTRETFVYFLRHKSEVFSKLVEFKTLVENQTNKKIKKFRSDNGKEFVNRQMSNLFKQCGIIHQLTCEYTPQSNGVAERANRTLMEKARSMLEEAGLERKYWAEAVQTAVHLKNRSPTKAVKGKTPEEAWSGIKPDLSELKVFGCKAYMHVNKEKRTKLDAKSKELTFVGYSTESKAYRLVDLKDGKLYKSRDVTFFENQFFNREKSELSTQKNNREIRECIPVTNRSDDHSTPAEQPDLFLECEEIENQSEINDSSVLVNQREERSSSSEQNIVEVEPTNNQEEVPDRVEPTDNQEEVPDQGVNEIEHRRYPLRERKQKDFSDFTLYHTMEEQQNDPLTVEEALKREDRDKWQQAINAELNALKKNGTWTLLKIDPRVHVNVVDSKWIFKIKKEPGGKERYKARLVARGFTQVQGIDYEETFSPVIRHSTLRLLLAIAVENDLQCDQMDVVTAFLNGDLSETVYMKQPKLCEEKGKEDHVCLLKKALYGLKQAPRAWNHKLHEALIEMKFKRSENEPCVYISKQNKIITIIAVYVDDILIFYNSSKERDKVKKELKSKFEMKDLGKIDVFLGMKINQQGRTIKVDQRDYIEKLLKDFGMSNCKPVKTPLEMGHKLTKPNDENYVPPKEYPYQKLIGSLMYLAVCSRPDISYAVSYLSQFNNSYTSEHWIAAKRIMRYLKGTADYRLIFMKKGEHITGYVDADHAGDICDRKSYSGYVFLLGGAPISWESKKQKTVALSSAEAEYIALSEACRETIFLKRLYAEIIGIDKTITLHSDSQSAIQIAKNPVHHQRTKHIDVRIHFIRDAVKEKVVTLKYLQTEEMTADIFTKVLPRCKFEFCVKEMNLIE